MTPRVIGTSMDADDDERMPPDSITDSKKKKMKTSNDAETAAVAQVLESVATKAEDAASAAAAAVSTSGKRQPSNLPPRSDRRAAHMVAIPSEAEEPCSSKGADPRRPIVAIGQYYTTRPWWCRARCKAYDAPPFDGRYITTIAPDTTLGPVENYLETTDYVFVCIRDYWINVWDRTYGVFASRVPERELQQWRMRGWQDSAGGGD